MQKQINLFYVYAQEDKRLRDKLEQHLSLLLQRQTIVSWYDQCIPTGETWTNKISTTLEEAHIILLLVSDAFLASNYCYGSEMAKALEKEKNGSTRIIPIILRHVDWQDAPFSHLQALPTLARPVVGSGWRTQDEAFTDIVRGIRKVVEELLSQPNDISSGKERQAQDLIKPGGIWISPIEGEEVVDLIKFAAFAYPTHPDDPPIDHVNFTVGWHGYWQVVSTIYPSNKASIFTSEVRISHFHLLPGEVQVSFDVYDQRGNVNLAPNGVHTIFYQYSK